MALSPLVPLVARAALLALLVTGAGCADVGEDRSLVELERMAFVPGGACTLQGYKGPLADCSISGALLVDLFEVTRGDARHHGIVAGWNGGDLDAGKDDHPAPLTWSQATELAGRRGMRLLTAREWVYVAVGRRSLAYPWGPGPQDSWANTMELGLGVTAPVGTFENGRSRPYGCYDLLGNVWEWVADRTPGSGDPVPRAAEFSVAGDELASVLGGSYRSRRAPTYGSPGVPDRGGPVFHARTLDRGTSAPDLGARMGAGAEEFLLGHAEDWGSKRATLVRLEKVGARWSAAVGRREVVPFLEDLVARAAATAGLQALLRGARGG